MATTGALAPQPGLRSPWVPWLARVRDVRVEIEETPASRRVATLELERGGLEWRPGQFLQVSRFSAGEVPISISSAPGLRDRLCITVRASGLVSSLIAGARPGDVLGLRGPAGNGFDLERCRGADVLFLAGGIGLAPLRGLLWEMLLRRSDFGRIVVVHGARSPHDGLYPWQYADWMRQGVDVRLTADRGDGVWESVIEPQRRIGLITTWLPALGLHPARTHAFLCGPPIMIREACRQLTGTMGFAPQRCVATLERHMKCGIGKCGHCIVGDRYMCVDGPVFRYDELQALARVEPPW
jgi:NAD(P)H-flavin reductase